MSKIEFLDHVAIKVVDPEASAVWYTRILGLKSWQPEEWRPEPIMVMSGASGIALFSDGGQPVADEVKQAFHIAFRITSLDGFRDRLLQEKVKFSEEDHTYFRSIYFEDPDGYRLEVTATVSLSNLDS